MVILGVNYFKKPGDFGKQIFEKKIHPLTCGLYITNTDLFTIWYFLDYKLWIFTKMNLFVKNAQKISPIYNKLKI